MMIYLDQAATSLHKPPEVLEAMTRAMHQCAGYGRSGHRAAVRAGEMVYACRETAAELFSMKDPSRVIFTMNATHALNLAIHGLCTAHTHVAVSGYEHNSVMRPLHHLGCPVHIIASRLFDQEDFLAGAEKAIQEGAELFIINHVSNVFGGGVPLVRLDALLQRYDIPMILDASQSAGVLDVSFLPSIRAICMPGHKGLLGPQGTGLLLLSPSADPIPLLQGGTGSASADLVQPRFFPDRLESGTPNIPGIAGLDAAIRFVLQMGTAEIRAQEESLRQLLVMGLRTIPRLDVFASDAGQSAVVSVRIPGMPAEQLAQALSERDVCVRAGLHCAPLAHETASTALTGTVRFSCGIYNTAEEMEQTVSYLQEIAQKL